MLYVEVNLLLKSLYLYNGDVRKQYHVFFVPSTSAHENTSVFSTASGMMRTLAKIFTNTAASMKVLY